MIELRAAAVSRPLVADSSKPSDLWLYNGTSPGPEIRVRKGERVRVSFISDLDEPSSIHWHGIRITNAMDGVSGLTQEPVPPGGRFEYDFVAPDAGTYWYHAHHHSWAQVGRGLYGPLIVEESEPRQGIEEVVLVLDDWRLDSEGALQTDFDDYMREKHFGRIGNHITVNGEPVGGSVSVRSDRLYRLRLINASNARVFRFRPNNMKAQIIALDGQDLQHPLMDVETIEMAPAQRTDLLFRPEKGEIAFLEDGDGTFGLGNEEGVMTAVFGFQADDGSATPYPASGQRSMMACAFRQRNWLPLVKSGSSTVLPVCQTIRC